MSREEKQIQDYKSKRLIDELLKMPPMVLEKAYRKSYYDVLQRNMESEG